jgi:hypothetical protein
LAQFEEYNEELASTCGSTDSKSKVKRQKRRLEDKKYRELMAIEQDKMELLRQDHARQAEILRNLSDRLEQKEQELHTTKIQVLEVLPMRLKINEFRRKFELLQQVANDSTIQSDTISKVSQLLIKEKLDHCATREKFEGNCTKMTELETILAGTAYCICCWRLKIVLAKSLNGRVERKSNGTICGNETMHGHC